MRNLAFFIILLLPINVLAQHYSTPEPTLELQLDVQQCINNPNCFSQQKPNQKVRFSLPVDCTYGQDCFIQKYVDTKKGTSYGDYQCGTLSNDQHKGTDFRLRDFTAMDKGVNVIAAADGVVKAIRDGEPDISIKNNTNYDAARACGNAVVLTHTNGWETMYCHMKQDSVAVAKGDKIARGSVLGQIGLSGKTEYPHLHFQMMHKGKVIDPFTGLNMESGCRIHTTKQPLWESTALKQLAYSKTQILGMGIADTPPDAQQARQGAYHKTILNNRAKALIIWADIMGPQQGDSLHVTVAMPDDVTRVLERTFDNTQALRFQYLGIKRTQDYWVKGTYHVSLNLNRNGTALLTEDFEFTVE